MAAPLSAIVLAGGASRRLGQDKAALSFGGRPLLHIVIERISAVCRQIIVAGARGRPDGSLPVTFVEDDVPDQGPLAGLHAGLAAASADFVLVVACDMPFLNTRLLAYMASLPRDYQALVPRLGGRQHPLHAIYAHSCLPVIESLRAQGCNSMGDLLARAGVRELAEEEVRRLDPEGLSLFNLNNRADLDLARSIWKERELGGDSEPATLPGK